MLVTSTYGNPGHFRAIQVIVSRRGCSKSSPSWTGWSSFQCEALEVTASAVCFATNSEHSGPSLGGLSSMKLRQSIGHSVLVLPARNLPACARTLQASA